MPDHTPAPWTVHPEKPGLVIASEGDIIAVCSGDVEGAPSANARLVAAAPDMLAALEAARDVLETANRYFPKSIRNRDTYSLLNTLANAVDPAIAKAKGETP